MGCMLGLSHSFTTAVHAAERCPFCTPEVLQVQTARSITKKYDAILLVCKEVLTRKCTH